jgi:hypothetical protein
MCRCSEVTGGVRIWMRLHAIFRSVAGHCIEVTGQERSGMRHCATTAVSCVPAVM